ncbi:MAG: response regulator [Deltaproteobacteria bacterium]|nr:response regulator [Deltaproteobacteria bacterium]MBW2015323.1 response regulator [Deltaproteobacteria bacterium]MBW2128184.1 response regulator [Deltaproteobacteria bacterium]MBW2303099.1 response regulator [Deltaproteobacteria bacterium]
MNPRKLIKGKMILIVDDEEDILQLLIDLLDVCKIDTASTFEQAKELLEKNYYDVAILDIMGVRGYDLLKIANERGIPALMLTAHALSKEDLKKSAEEGASFYAPKDEINKIDVFVADIIEAREKNKNIWARWYERLAGFCDRRFGVDWREQDREFWDNLIKY